MDVESYQEGYRLGFEAGRASAQQASVAEAMAGLRAAAPPLRRLPLPPERRCDCGHADTTHNELGYCQARGKAGSDGCHCETFDNDHARARSAARRAART